MESRLGAYASFLIIESVEKPNYVATFRICVLRRMIRACTRKDELQVRYVYLLEGYQLQSDVLQLGDDRLLHLGVVFSHVKRLVQLADQSLHVSDLLQILLREGEARVSHSLR